MLSRTVYVVLLLAYRSEGRMNITTTKQEGRARLMTENGRASLIERELLFPFFYCSTSKGTLSV